MSDGDGDGVIHSFFESIYIDLIFWGGYGLSGDDPGKAFGV